QYQLLVDNIPAVVWSKGPDGSADFLNQYFQEYTGISTEEARGWGWMNAFHPDDRAMDEWRAALAAGEPFEKEARLRGSDGQYRWFALRAVPLRDQRGNIVKWYGTTIDIDDRKQAETRVRQAERELRLAIDTIPALVWTTLPDGSLDFINQRWAEIGLCLRDLQGSEWAAVIHPAEIAGVIDKWNAAVATGQPYENVERVRRADGEYRWFLSRAAPLRDASGKIVKWYGTDIDIEDWRRAEEALRKVQAELAHVTRPTPWGDFTASTVHEVNQPLAAIGANGNACLRWLGRDVPQLDEARGAVEHMISDGNRAAEVIRRVRALAKKTDAPKVPLPINGVIEEVILLLQPEVLSHRAVLRLELASELPLVLADRIQLQQVIINLVMNGMEAMAPVTDRPRELKILSQREADQVLVAVQDSGVGIDPEHVDRLFNSFFTTKLSGMGMGLSICRSIIEAHGGKLWASCNAGAGATFQFTL